MKVATRFTAGKAALLLLALGPGLLLACAGEAATPASGPAGTVTLAVHTFAKEVLDPSLDSMVGRPYHGEMFDWFIGATPDGKISLKNGVLESYKPNADASVWTLTLKKDVKWHDGTDVTADDMKFSIEYYMRPEAVCTACGGLKANVERVQVVDRHTATIRLKSPDVTLPAALSPMEGDLMILPKHYIERVGPKEFGEKPMGSGPWRLVSRKVTQSIEYAANPKYWNRDRIPGFAALRLLLVPENRTRLAMLRRAEVDMIPVEPQDVAVLKREGFTILGPKYTASTTLLFWKSYDPRFITNKLEIRKALALAVDWDGLFKAIYPPEVAERYRGGGAIFTPLNVGYDPSLPAYKYDPTEAKRLLQQGGYTGETVKFWSFASFENPEQKEVNEIIAGYWRAVGLNVQLIPIDFGSFVPKYVSSPQRFDPPIEVGVMSPIPRPSTLGNLRIFMISHKAGGRIWSYWNPDWLDGVYKEVAGIVDDGRRERRLREINKKLYEEYWAVPIALRHFPWATRNIADWQPTDGSPLSMSFETLKPRR
jgi:peptide/nickel transport system substrate-binding protein